MLSEKGTFQFNTLHYLVPYLFHCSRFRQEVLFLDNEIAFNEAIIEEREQGIQEIQQQIGEVNEIFKDLAVLVHEQGAMIGNLFLHLFLLVTCIFLLLYLFIYFLYLFMLSDVANFHFVDDIGSNIENSHAATAQAKTQLAKASKTQRSNSSLVIYNFFYCNCITFCKSRPASSPRT